MNPFTLPANVNMFETYDDNDVRYVSNAYTHDSSKRYLRDMYGMRVNHGMGIAQLYRLHSMCDVMGGVYNAAGKRTHFLTGYPC